MNQDNRPVPATPRPVPTTPTSDLETRTSDLEMYRSEWEAFAPHWIERCRRGEINRIGFLDAWMRDLLGPVDGLRLIDLGCGEGRFCRMLAARHARAVLGIDLCRPLIEAAERLRSSDRETYRVADMQRLDGLPAAAFDVAVSYLSLVDVPDLTAAVCAAHRVLADGGRFVICNLAPLATATNARVVDPDGSRNAFRVDRYFEETERIMPFKESRITNFHRTLSTYVNTFIKAGFAIRRIEEPMPDDASLERYPELANERRAPTFILFDLLKSRPLP